MKNIIHPSIVFAILFSFFEACSSIPANSAPVTSRDSIGKGDLGKQMIRGKVKEITTRSAGNDNALNSIGTEVYDGNGNRLSEVFSFGNDTEKVIYYYKNAELVLSKHYLGSALNDSVEYVYDGKGKKTIESHFSIAPAQMYTRHFTYQYDANGNLTREFRVTDNRDTTRIIHSFFDTNGKIARQIDSNKGDVSRTDPRLRRNIYTYDLNGNRSMDSSFVNKQFDSVMENKYDQMGNVVQTVSRSANGKTTTSTFSYEYDGHGNWIKCQYYINAVLIRTQTRQIEYY
jgi:hypothetical protein